MLMPAVPARYSVLRRHFLKSYLGIVRPGTTGLSSALCRCFSRQYTMALQSATAVLYSGFRQPSPLHCSNTLRPLSIQHLVSAHLWAVPVRSLAMQQHPFLGSIGTLLSNALALSNALPTTLLHPAPAFIPVLHKHPRIHCNGAPSTRCWRLPRNSTKYWLRVPFYVVSGAQFFSIPMLNAHSGAPFFAGHHPGPRYFHPISRRKFKFPVFRSYLEGGRAAERL